MFINIFYLYLIFKCVAVPVSSHHYMAPLKWIVPLLCFSLIFCRKNDTPQSKTLSTGKILAYLEAQKIKPGEKPAASRSNANIDILEKNLDLTAVKNEQLDKKYNLLVVPVNDEALEAYHLDKTASLTLILMTEKSGKIRSCTVIYFQPTDGHKCRSFPENTFGHLLSGKTVEVDGTYKMITETGKWLSQFQIKNHKLFSLGTVQQKSNSSRGTQITGSCVDWYLVTTYFYSDGTTSREEMYLGTTCPGDCGGSDFATLCSSGGDGGGTGSSGDGNPQPDEVVTDEDQAETLDSDLPPSADLSNAVAPNTDLIVVDWQAFCPFSYIQSTGEILTVEPQKPFPVPVSQTFRDDNGHPAILRNETGPWSSIVTPTGFRSRYVSWSFIGIFNYTYTTGFVPIWKNEYMAKAIASH